MRASEHDAPAALRRVERVHEQLLDRQLLERADAARKYRGGVQYVAKTRIERRARDRRGRCDAGLLEKIAP